MADTTRMTPASPVRGTTTPVPASDRQNGKQQNQQTGTALSEVKEIGTELAGAVRDSATNLPYWRLTDVDSAIGRPTRSPRSARYCANRPAPSTRTAVR